MFCIFIWVTRFSGHNQSLILTPADPSFDDSVLKIVFGDFLGGRYDDSNIIKTMILSIMSPMRYSQRGSLGWTERTQKGTQKSKTAQKSTQERKTAQVLNKNALK